MPFSLADFDFDLPEALIAQHPAAERAASRLLHVAGDLAASRFDDLHFRDLPALIRPGDLLVFNDTRVIKARFEGAKDSGGRIEVLIERIIDKSTALAQIRASKSPKPGSRLRLADAFACRVDGRSGEFFVLGLADAGDWWAMTEAHGRLPLPPYISHDAEAEDEERYQTVYARHAGAVAAPTAGLHFDAPLLAQLRAAGADIAWLTLHVGAGTFQPVRVDNLAEHRMHRERYTIPAATIAAIHRTRTDGGRVIAVGTTSLRALEASAAGRPDGQPQAGDSEADLFILPGFRFQVVDRLITNFHLPKSTLLMLVSAFAGFEQMRRAYRHAIANDYRFFSYGDAMLLERTSEYDSDAI